MSEEERRTADLEFTSDLQTQVVERLMARGFHIACAESCTGGMLTARLVDVPNVSRVLDVSFVTYANEAKLRFLGVNAATIAQVGVVSEAVAGEMAAGAARTAKTEVGVGISGIAGPSGGTPEKPVGTVCFGFFIQGRVVTETCHFTGLMRNQVREESVRFALTQLLTLL